MGSGSSPRTPSGEPGALGLRRSASIWMSSLIYFGGKQAPGYHRGAALIETQTCTTSGRCVHTPVRPLLFPCMRLHVHVRTIVSIFGSSHAFDTQRAFWPARGHLCAQVLGERRGGPRASYCCMNACIRRRAAWMYVGMYDMMLSQPVRPSVSPSLIPSLIRF